MTKSDPIGEIRRVAFCAVVLSTAAVIAAVISLPMLYSYVQGLQSHIQQEMDFCKAKSRTLMMEMLSLQNQKGFGHRQRRAWLFGQWWGSPNDQFGTYASGAPPGVEPTKTASGGYDTGPTVSGVNPENLPTADVAVTAPEICCTCRQGPVGLPGPSGTPGRDGLDGRNGTDGKNGRDGRVLASPPAPPPCVVCPPGPAGPVGDKGEKGHEGPKGEPGMPGTPGSPGRRGGSGPRGNAGNSGLNGAQGAPGDPGVIIQREGPPGRPGTSGPAGATGPIGPPGTPGQPGSAGFQGDQGETGDQGTDGTAGTQGPPGLPGYPGPHGDCRHCPPPRLPPGYFGRS